MSIFMTMQSSIGDDHMLTIVNNNLYNYTVELKCTKLFVVYEEVVLLILGGSINRGSPVHYTSKVTTLLRLYFTKPIKALQYNYNKECHVFTECFLGEKQVSLKTVLAFFTGADSILPLG